MPYFVFKLHPPRIAEPVRAFDGYRDARALAREMRAGLGPDDRYMVRVVFAASEPEAERLLTEVREARPLGEDA